MLTSVCELTLVVTFLLGSSELDEGLLFPRLTCRGLLDHLQDVTGGLLEGFCVDVLTDEIPLTSKGCAAVEGTFPSDVIALDRVDCGSDDA